MPHYLKISIGVSLLVAFLYYGYRDDYRRLGALGFFKTILIVIAAFAWIFIKK